VPLSGEVLPVSLRCEVQIQLRGLLRLLLKSVQHDNALSALRDLEHAKRALGPNPQLVDAVTDHRHW
jgi:hypothetical protein